MRLLLCAAPLALLGCESGTADRGEATAASETSTVASDHHIDPIDRNTLIRPVDAPLPNVVFILVDTLRADRLGCYGYGRQLTPTMDALAAEGVRFDRVIAAAPWTLPSIGSLITSYAPSVHKATSFRQVDGMDRGMRPVVAMLGDQFVTLAEAMQQAGYETAGFSANKFIKAKYGFGQGYELYDTHFADNTVPGKYVNAAALRWLEQRQSSDKPLFLYLHYMDVHGPYDADPRFLDPLMKEVENNPNRDPMPPRVFKRINAYIRRPPRKTSDPTRWDRLSRTYDYWRARYDAGVAEMDFYLSQLFDKLKQDGLWDNTLIVLTADHGESLGESGFWDHGYTMLQTNLHVPLIMRYPGVLPAGRSVYTTVSLMDVAPTLYEMLRVPFDQNIQGRSLVDVIAGTKPQPVTVFADAIKVGPRQLVVVDGRWKLIAMSIPNTNKIRQLLFDIEADPTEQHELSAEHPDIVKRLRDKLVQQLEVSSKLKPHVRRKTVAPTPAELKQLQAVGYTGGSDEDDQDEPAEKP